MDLVPKHCHSAVPKLSLSRLLKIRGVKWPSHPYMLCCSSWKILNIFLKGKTKMSDLRRAFETSNNPYSHGILPAGLEKLWSGKITEGKKVTAQKLQGKYSFHSRDGAWWVCLTSHTKHSLRGSKQRMEQSRDHCQDLSKPLQGREGTWWYFLAEKLRSTWKTVEIKKALELATMAKSLSLDWHVPHAKVVSGTVLTYPAPRYDPSVSEMCGWSHSIST